MAGLVEIVNMSLYLLPGILMLFWCAGTALASELTSPRFRPVDIDSHIEIGYGIALADVDGDLKLDILLADKRQIVWYRNPTWEKFVIAENLTSLDNVCLAAADVDGDGKAEIAVGAGWNPSDTTNSGAVFYLVAPPDRTKKWDTVALPHEPTVHRMRWLRNTAGQFELVVVPLHGRGNQATTGTGVRILAYQRPVDPRGEWKTGLVNDSLHATHNFDLVKWNAAIGDELLVAGKEGVFHMFNQGTGWESHPLSGVAGQGGAGEVRAGRLPGGKKFVTTIEPMHGNQLVVYTEGATERSPGATWKRRLLDDLLQEGHALACGDLFGNDFDQIVVGWRGKNREGKVGVKVFWAIDPGGEKWDQAVVDDNTVACEDLCLADLNGDGRLDLVLAGRATHNLKVLLNETQKSLHSLPGSEALRPSN
jgi:hypothetical protein